MRTWPPSSTATPDNPSGSIRDRVAAGQELLRSLGLARVHRALRGGLAFGVCLLARRAGARPHGAARDRRQAPAQRDGAISPRRHGAGRSRARRAGFSDVRHVRLMHAAVRWLVQNDPRVHWDPAWGTPINQEDLLETLLTFTEIVFEVFDRTGVASVEEDADDYLHTWSLHRVLPRDPPRPAPADPRADVRPDADRPARQFGAQRSGSTPSPQPCSAQGTRLVPPGLRGLPASTVRYYVGDRHGGPARRPAGRLDPVPLRSHGRPEPRAVARLAAPALAAGAVRPRSVSGCCRSPSGPSVTAIGPPSPYRPSLAERWRMPTPPPSAQPPSTTSPP